MDTILLTGFGPYGHHEANVSERAVARIDGLEHDGFVFKSLQLPMEFEKASALLADALETERPAAVIACGIHEGTTYRLELVAKNDRTYAQPDGAGKVVSGEPVEPGGPSEVFSTLPVGGIKLRLEDAGLSAELCEDAGRYLCNAIFYKAVRGVSPAGFFHVPAAATVDDVSRAVKIAATVTADRLASQRVEATA